jgi:hypothetical protein
MDKRLRRWWVLSPTLGICLFGLLYVLAACQYPGGSNVSLKAAGFSWQHNYWCDLLGSTGKNGMYNPGRPVAITAMLVLGSSLSAFWWLLSYLYTNPNRMVRLGQWAGVLSMIIVLFIGTPHHDLVMNTAGLFGVLALAATFVALYKNRLFKLGGYGLVCMLLVGANNYVYYTHHYLYYLPIIQKITFVLFLLWVALINWKVYQLSQRRIS